MSALTSHNTILPELAIGSLRKLCQAVMVYCAHV